MQSILPRERAEHDDPGFSYSSLNCVCSDDRNEKSKGGRVGIWGPAHWGLGEIDVLLVPPGKASNLQTDHLTTGSCLSLPRKSGLVNPSIHISLTGLAGWLYL